MSISVVLPAYTEAENLQMLLPKLKQTLLNIGCEWEILVVDTQQPLDNTKEVCQTHEVTYLPREGDNNYGDAIRTGFHAAQMKYTVIMDSDGSHDPQDICKFYDYIVKHEQCVVIGSRYIEGGQTHNGPILKFMSFMVNIVYRLVFSIKIKDVSDSFRMYPTNCIATLPLQCDNFDIVEEILIRLTVQYPNIELKEVPIFFNKRLYGQSKRNLIKFVFSYITSIAKMVRIKIKAQKEMISAKD